MFPGNASVGRIALLMTALLVAALIPPGLTSGQARSHAGVGIASSPSDNQPAESGSAAGDPDRSTPDRKAGTRPVDIPDVEFYLAQETREREYRGVWSGPRGLYDDWDRSMRILSENHFSAVFPLMLRAGLAYYPSEVLPMSAGVSKENDPLARCVKAAKKHGIEVHVWKISYNLGGAPPEFVQQLRDQGRLQKNYDGNDVLWLCPSHPDNLKLELDSILEVVRNYHIDGIHFDYIRYPSKGTCFCDTCRERFEEDTGRAVRRWPRDVVHGDLARAYTDWRREQITQLVRVVSREARRLRPGIAISAAVKYNWGKNRVTLGQDPDTWLRRGLVDFVVPMLYAKRSSDLQHMIGRQVRAIGKTRLARQGRVPVYIGLKSHGLSPRELVEQIQLIRRRGAYGFVLFKYTEELAEGTLPALRLGVTKAPPLSHWDNY